ncbi:hypothetical protein OV450_7996 [Actinobacteria bacterium OV450]|nr:hypothetical protein OV450_7996 [Actinobacteria bacterium OV450]
MEGFVAMLLPGNLRVVVEVDDLQRYPRNEGAEPDSAKYAATMAGDRALKFRGYEVFRFGHDELRDRVQPFLAGFFATLLDRSPTGPSGVPLPVRPWSWLHCCCRAAAKSRYGAEAGQSRRGMEVPL